MRPLRLAVDARVVANDPRGIGRYARAVLRRLIQRPDVDLTLLEFGPFAFRHRGALSSALGSSRFALRSSAKRGYDLVWHPANGTFFTSEAPNVATIHDAVAFLTPDADAKRRANAQEPILRSARTAVRVITDSSVARDELHAVLGVPLERIEAIHLGVDAWFSPGDVGPLPGGLTPGTYLLFIGPTREPRKNFELFYDAYRRAFAERGPLLAVVGPTAPDAPNVVHVPAVDDEGLRALYRGALALALPATYEAFGLPMLEAMACGTPVVASRASALPEIGGDAALYAPPGDVEQWAQTLNEIAGDEAPRARLRDAGLQRARAFDWDTCAQRHFELFAAVAGR